VENEDQEVAENTGTHSPLVAQVVVPSAIQSSKTRTPNSASPHVEAAPLPDVTSDRSEVIQDSEACTPPNPASPHIGAAPLHDTSIVSTDTAPPGRPKPRPAYQLTVAAPAATKAAVITDIDSPPHRSQSPSPPPSTLHSPTRFHGVHEDSTESM